MSTITPRSNVIRPANAENWTEMPSTEASCLVGNSRSSAARYCDDLPIGSSGNNTASRSPVAMPARNASGSVVRFEPNRTPTPWIEKPGPVCVACSSGEHEPALRARRRGPLVEPKRGQHEAVGEDELERPAEALCRLVVEQRAAADDLVEDVDLDPGALGDGCRPAGRADAGHVAASRRWPCRR